MPFGRRLASWLNQRLKVRLGDVMTFQKSKQARKELIEIALLLRKLPPDRRKALMIRVMRERGLHSKLDPVRSTDSFD